MEIAKSIFGAWWRWSTKTMGRFLIGMVVPVILAIALVGSALPSENKEEGIDPATLINRDFVPEGAPPLEAEAPPEPTQKPGPKPTATLDLTSTSGETRYSACDIATKFVKQRLKAPSTAKFQKCADVRVVRDDKTWTLQGHVDAQNSFGAALRNTYRVVVFLESQDKTNNFWKLVDLQLSE